MTQQHFRHAVLAAGADRHRTAAMIGLHHLDQRQWTHAVQQHRFHRAGFLRGQVMRIEIGLMAGDNRLRDAPGRRTAQRHHGRFIKRHAITGQHFTPRFTVRWLGVQNRAVHVENKTLIAVVHRYSMIVEERKLL